MQRLSSFLGSAATQDHPLRVLREFLARENDFKSAKMYDKMRFVGYVLEIGYEAATIITSDPFKTAVGGVPRGSILFMVPDDFSNLPLHCTLLRVAEAAPTPLSSSVAQTYFELQKKSMPELDVFTQSELQWGALRTTVLGMLYPNPDQANRVEFSGDVNNFVSAHRYRVYAPDTQMQELIVNALIDPRVRFELGHLRLTECRLDRLMPENQNTKSAHVPVYIASSDFRGTRTAMFGKTRLGKSNVIKLLAENLILATSPEYGGEQQTLPSNSIGQLVFDQDGEYSNDNPQDENISLRSKYEGRCQVYALVRKDATPSKPLKLNFYEQPARTHEVLGSLLEADDKLTSAYIRAFASVALPEIEEVSNLSDKEITRPRRKLQMYWAILTAAGFAADETRLRAIPKIGFDPGFAAQMRANAYAIVGQSQPGAPNNLDELVRELRVMAQANRPSAGGPLRSTSGGDLFDIDDTSLLDFLEPLPGRAGVSLITPYRAYHGSDAGNFVSEILNLVDAGRTVLLDLGNANDELMRYFSDMLTRAVFAHQVMKFTNNSLGDHFIQVYFEEAHNLFPRTDVDLSKTYARLAKEGAKYHIGMVYSTQSPTTVSKDLLKNTENFFITHLSAKEDVQALADLNVAYEPVKDEILHSRTPGYIRMLTRSHRFVVAAQARRFGVESTLPAVNT